jgi:hypothetical protein
MKRLLLAIAFLLVYSAAFAQVPSAPTDIFVWHITASNLTEAQGFRYEAEIDGTLHTLPHLCGVLSLEQFPNIQCAAAMPPLATGSHQVRARAVNAAEPETPPGPWSEPMLHFSLRVIPGQILNLTIRPKSGAIHD